MEQAPVLAIVIPCFNEAEVLPATSPAFRAKIEELVGLGMVSARSYVLFVDDGSSDATWSVIEGLAADGGVLRGIKLSRNRGHQNALLAGLMEVRGKCDISISIDCDGQDDIDAMNKMVEAYRAGAEVVYGVRSSRKTDTAFKRGSAQAFYKLLSSMGAETVYNHADYRLLSNKVLDALSQFEEVNLFLRGMVPLVGFNSTSVYYERHERVAGESHYPLRKMVALAVDGITSLSVKPIRLITLLGITVSIVSFIGVIWAIVTALMGNSVAGWASLVCVLCLLSGVQLLSIGVIGEYVGKTYLETKHRPRFIVSQHAGFDDASDAPEA
ncbi:glycosyltransferase family 2 protein [uncultured Slackia sp.]|uniref:glycosyltransferase family 2 protein n=1 Tax=uncultured Slackia sp. TaxID=665903 RepID=UPI0026DFD17B|nr:glycosyltransferase family 2 protein [uncultured Slackia sp.]